MVNQPIGNHGLGISLCGQMSATGVSLPVMKSASISLIIGPRGLGW